MAFHLDRGTSGEQDMGFFWGERGYVIIDGPGGAAGHAGNARGFDGVAFNPTTGHLVIYDNKSFKAGGNVNDASAINKNLAANLDSLIPKVQAIQGFDGKAAVVKSLQEARSSLTTGPQAWPTNVDLAVSNAGGNSTGVSAKLADKGVKFIDYMNAPSPRPPIDNEPNGSPSSGSKPSASGDTRRVDTEFHQAALPALAAAFDMFKRWGEEMSMITAAIEAWNALLDHEREVAAEQNLNPTLPTYIEIYWKITSENNPVMPHYHRFLGLDVKNGGRAAAVYDANQKSYQMILPPIAARKDTPPVATEDDKSWRGGLTKVLGALAHSTGTDFTPPDPNRALALLNGSPMYDILAILTQLKRTEPYALNQLENAMNSRTAGVDYDRLQAAFMAVRLFGSGPGALTNYKATCREFPHLPDDQQADIEKFLGGTLATVAPETPVGKWIVRVSQWVWLYTFDAKGNVTWLDQGNGMSGHGRWTMGKTSMVLTWTPSKTIDYWNLPLDPASQKGSTNMEDVGWRALVAAKQPA